MDTLVSYTKENSHLAKEGCYILQPYDGACCSLVGRGEENERPKRAVVKLWWCVGLSAGGTKFYSQCCWALTHIMGRRIC